jgi:hypothetical protein
LLFSGERESERTVQNWDNTKNKAVSNYSDREASVFQKPEKEVIPPMASESNPPMPSTPNTEAIEAYKEKESEEKPQSGIQGIPSEIQRKQYYPNTEKVPQYPGGKNFNRTFKCDVQQKQWPTYIVRRRYYRPPMSSNCVAIGTIRRSPIPVIQQRVSFQSTVARIETYSYRAGQFNSGYFIARRIGPPYQRRIQPPIRAYYYSQYRPYCFR